MRRWQFSLKGLLYFMLCAGLGLLCLKYASDNLASIAFTLVSLILIACVLGACCDRGAGRARFLGFVILGGGYWILAFAPGFEANVRPLLISSKALDSLRDSLWRPDPVVESDGTLLPSQTSKAVYGGGSALSSMPWIYTWQPSAAGPWWPSGECYMQVGHSFFVLLLGLLGCTLGSYFQNRSSLASARNNDPSAARPELPTSYS